MKNWKKTLFFRETLDFLENLLIGWMRFLLNIMMFTSLLNWRLDIYIYINGFNISTIQFHISNNKFNISIDEFNNLPISSIYLYIND